MAKAAKLAIVEAEHIVGVGEIDPNDVDLPGIFVDRIVPATEESQVEILKTRSADAHKASKPKGDSQLRRDRIARRAAKELKPGFYVNLGVGENNTFQHGLRLETKSFLGIPTMAPSFLPPGQQVWIQSENGILGMGDYPLPDEVDPYALPLPFAQASSHRPFQCQP